MSARKQSGLWDQVKQMVLDGQSPVLTLPEGHKVITPKRSPGRPRTRDLLRPYKHFALHTPSGMRMRCRARGCGKQLRRDATSIVCSEACKHAMLDEAHAVIACLEGETPVRDFPVYLRDYRAKKVG